MTRCGPGCRGEPAYEHHTDESLRPRVRSLPRPVGLPHSADACQQDRRSRRRDLPVTQAVDRRSQVHPRSSSPAVASDVPQATVLQPIAEREPAVGLAGAFVGGQGAVACQHGPGLPTGQPHQVGLAPALGELLVGEGMP